MEKKQNEQFTNDLTRRHDIVLTSTNRSTMVDYQRSSLCELVHFGQKNWTFE